jgi:hypothetical protein
LGGIAETLQFLFIKMRGLLHADFLGDWHEAIDAQIGHGFVSRLDSLRVQFDPTGIGKFDEATGCGLQPLEVRGGKFEAFLFPFGAYRQPINAAAFDNETRAEASRCQKEPVKSGVAEAFGGLGTLGPDGCKCAKEVLIGITDPKARFGRKPVEAAQPLGGWVKARVVKNLWFVARATLWFAQLPFVAVPKPGAVIALAFSNQPQPNGFIEQFENELWRGRMRDNQLFPIDAMIGLRFAQMHQQAMAQFADGNGRLIGPMLQQLRWGRVSQEVKGVAYQRERRATVEEANFFQFMSFSARNTEPVREGKLTLTIDQMGGQLGDLAMEFEHSLRIVRGQFKA